MYTLDILLITGISGSGKSVALRLLEDLGYTCVDNLPLSLLGEMIRTAQRAQTTRLAIAIDARTLGEMSNLPKVIKTISGQGHNVRVIFLDASTQSLVARYSETRRPHPMSDKLNAQARQVSLEEAIEYERNLLAYPRDIGHVIDTSGLTPGQLRTWIRELVQTQRQPLVLTFQSFAFKTGVPLDADLVFDMRCLPNPYYDPLLRPLTGKDQQVADYLCQFDIVQQMIDDIRDFLTRWLPHYRSDTRGFLTVAIGCTGGQHRSVYVVEQLAHVFASDLPLVRHRAQHKLT